MNLHFHGGTKIGKGGPVLAAKIGPGGPVLAADRFFRYRPDHFFLLYGGGKKGMLPHDKICLLENGLFLVSDD